MQIVTDSAADLAPSQLAGLPIHFTTLRLSLSGKPFTGTNEEFYKKLSETDDYPVTSQAAAGEFAELYRNVAKKDPAERRTPVSHILRSSSVALR